MPIPVALLNAPLPLPFLNDPQPRGSFEEAMVRQFSQLAKDVETREVSLDAISKEATSGRPFSNQELLVLQAKMHEYAFELELLSKVVEQAVQGLRDVLRTQV